MIAFPCGAQKDVMQPKDIGAPGPAHLAAVEGGGASGQVTTEFGDSGLVQLSYSTAKLRASIN